MFTAILWDYDGTLANTPVKNIAVTRAVLGRLDPALLDPLPEALSSLDAYQAANYRWRNWRELYQHALRVPADRLDEAGALWGPCQLADRTLPPLFGGLLEVLPRLAALAPMGICSPERQRQHPHRPGRPRRGGLLCRRGGPRGRGLRPSEAGPRRLPGLPGPAGASGGALRLHRGPRRGHRLRPQCPGGPAGHGPGGGGGLRGRCLGRRPRPWIWRRRTPWPPAPRTCRIFWQTCDTTAAPPGTSAGPLSAGGFCLCFVFWCAMIF